MDCISLKWCVKSWISLASQAHHIPWFAKTDAEAGNRGITGFVIETDLTGVTAADIHGKMGSRASSAGWVNCRDVHVPLSHRIGEEAEGFKIAMSCLDNARYTVGSGCVGTIRASLEASVKYARERKAFGRAIGHFQLIQKK